jgi:hypothetical protein
LYFLLLSLLCEQIQIELLEMEVETKIVQQTVGVEAKADSQTMREEALAWARLFSKKYIGRTWIGILIMFFQRASFRYVARTLDVIVFVQNGAA